MLCKLALDNIRRVRRDYTIYLITLTLGVTVFYAFNTIALQVDIAGIQSYGLSELLGRFLTGLTYFLAAIMGFLMVYATNFIMRRRKREFGLYQVLGMSRWQTACVMVFETVFVALAALGVGLVLGVALSQLMVFFTASLFRSHIANFHFFFSIDALLITLACLAVIFCVTLLFNLRVVARSRIVDLMSAHRQSERVHVRNPWISAIIFLAGVIIIAVSYARLLADGLPLAGKEDDFSSFGITTALVTVGTVLLFFGLSGTLLRALQGTRAFYWRGLAPFTLRQLASRINTVSTSLAVVTLVLFLALTSVVTGMSVAGVMNENLEAHTPVDWSTSFYYWQAHQIMDEAYDSQSPAQIVPSEFPNLETVLNTHEMPEGGIFNVNRIADATLQINFYRPLVNSSSKPLVSLDQLALACGRALPSGMESADTVEYGLPIMRESDYNRYLAFMGLDEVDLGNDGYLITCDAGESLTSIYDAVLSSNYALTLAGQTLMPAIDVLDSSAGAFCNSVVGSNMGTLVLPDSVADALDLPLYYSHFLLNYAEGVTDKAASAYLDNLSYGEDAWQVLDVSGNSVGYWGVSSTRTSMYESTYASNGLISYLAIYIGFVLVVAVVAILAIQQLSSVADAGKSVKMLSQIGTPIWQIRRSFLVQQAIFFLSPLIVGVAHALVALSVLVSVVKIFGHLSIGAMTGVAAVIFVAAYGGYFLVTWSMTKSMLKA